MKAVLCIVRHVPCVVAMLPGRQGVGFSDMRGNMRVVLVLLMSLGLAGCWINDHTRHRAIDLEFNG
ncbi:MAG: hypothetical protein ACKVH7_17045, partial [Alphaproteobacteria bacterium]